MFNHYIPLYELLLFHDAVVYGVIIHFESKINHVYKTQVIAGNTTKQDIKQKYRIRETLTLLTCVNNSIVSKNFKK